MADWEGSNEEGTENTNGTGGPVPFEVLFWIAATLFAVTLASEGFFHPLFFAGLQVEGVAFDFLDDVFLLHFAFKAPQSIFKGFAVLHDNFCHLDIHLLAGQDSASLRSANLYCSRRGCEYRLFGCEESCFPY